MNNISELAVVLIGLALLLPIYIIGGPWAQALAALSLMGAHLTHAIHNVGNSPDPALFYVMVGWATLSLLSGAAAITLFVIA